MKTAVDPDLLANLDPISSLSPKRLAELAGLCFVETVSKDMDPFRMNVIKAQQALYLLKGQLGLRFLNGQKRILAAGSREARQPVVDASAGLKYARALTDLEIVRIDMDLLDIMMTWDQLATFEKSTEQAAEVREHRVPAADSRGTAAWMQETGIFSVEKLQRGVFSKLPPSNIEEMFRRMEPLPVHAGQAIIVQGAEGDYYYLIEHGTAEVTRTVEPGHPPRLLAELHAGDAFGEDALVSDARRNATVTMKTAGNLLRLNKANFIELLQAPLLTNVSYAEASARMAAGTGLCWLDVRFPSEYGFDHLPDAINVPLHEIRDVMQNLDPDREYITYCQTGRRSSAAAFIMAQRGFKVCVLAGGLRTATLA